MADELPTFESIFRKSKGLDLAEEAPSEEESTPSEEQRSRVSDKLTDEDGNTRLKHKANVPALENYDQDIRAPQGEVHDADKLKATRKSAGIREMIARECFEKTGRIPDVDFMDTYEVKKAALDAESDTPIQDREARRRIGEVTPRLVERTSSLNEGAPLTDTDGQEIGQVAGASSASHAYDTNDFTMENAALKNENALEKALRGYLDSNPNITIEDLEKFIESSKGGFRIGVERPFL